MNEMHEFLALPLLARRIAHDCWLLSNGSVNILTRLLDADKDFREAVGVVDMHVLPSQVDCVVRYYSERA